MSKRDKTLEQVLSGTSDANVSFNDLCQLMRHLGFDERTRSSHHVFRKHGILERINLQRDGNKAKPSPSSSEHTPEVQTGRK